MGIVDFFSEYGSYHHNVVNKWIHIMCVPMILICANGHGEFAKFNEWNLVLIVNTCAVLFYMSMDLTSGFVCALWMYGGHFLGMRDLIAGNENAHAIIAAVHSFSWIAQFVGHGVFEGRKPALMDNLLQVFSAPLFVTLEVLFMLGYAPELEKKCEAAVLKKLPKTDSVTSKKSS